MENKHQEAVRKVKRIINDKRSENNLQRTKIVQMAKESNEETYTKMKWNMKISKCKTKYGNDD